MNEKELETIIKDAARRYYSNGTSPLTDFEFDQYVEQLREINPDNELLHTPGWGYDPEGLKFKHKYGIAGSLQKCRTYNEIPKSIIESAMRSTGPVMDFSLKLDGLSCLLYYRDGKLYQALTRGDGVQGIDITHKVKLLHNSSFPTTLKVDKDFTGCIRGELLMSFADFANYKEEHPEAKNPRNSVAGIINGKDTLDDLKYVNLICYTVVGDENHFDKDTISIGKIRNFISRNLGEEHCVPFTTNTLLADDKMLDQMQKLKDMWYGTYPADGIVLTSENVHKSVNEITYDACAFKFESEIKETTVRNIEWNLSKGNLLVPTLVVDPIELAETTVQRATGYNAKWIKDNHIGLGSIVKIEKRGEIIPNVIEIVERTQEDLPTVCPDCGQELIWNGVHLQCNNPECPHQIMQDSIWFMMHASPVKGLADTLVERFLSEMVEIGMINSFSVKDIMESNLHINKTASAQYNLFAEMWNNLHDANRKISFTQALVSLNIPHLGELTAKKFEPIKDKILEYCHTAACETDLSYIAGPAIISYINDNWDRFENLKYLEAKLETSTSSNNETVFMGNVAITGKLSCSRKEFEEKLNKLGWKLTELTKNCAYLITNDPNSGSAKNAKADKLGIKKVTEEEFMSLNNNIAETSISNENELKTEVSKSTVTKQTHRLF